MATVVSSTRQRPLHDVRGPALPRHIHPLHAMLLAFPLPLFTGALASDVAYWRTWDVQWANFSAWLNAGALLFAGLAILWALVALIAGFRSGERGRAIYLLALIAMFAVGLVNAFVHAKDAAATMPLGLILSAVTFALAVAASWLGFAGFRVGGVK